METEKTNITGTLKRVLSFVLCCAMVLSCVPSAVFAAGIPEDTPAIEEGVEATAVIEEAGGRVYFSFTPENTESYTFYSIGNEDTYGYVYNSRMALLACDNNNGDNKNFSVTYTFLAGNTYILCAFYYSTSDTGSFSVMLKANHKGTIAATIPASCTQDGLGTGICDDCGKEYTEVIPATGHLLNEENICTKCGEGLNGAGTCGENLKWMLNQDGLLTIYGSGKMVDYSSSNTAPWYGSRTTITSVVIQQGVTSIGNYAFYGCIKLANISIPEDVSSIGSSAFELCNKLEGISIPSSVTEIGNGAFYECSKLAVVTIPDGVTFIGSNAFYGCSSLKSITIPEGVTSIGGYAFSGCSSLSSIAIPEGVRSIEWGIFSGCSSLNTVTILGDITSIGWDAFYGCSSLSSITIPEGVTSIGGEAFKDCSSLSSVAIPEGVASIGSYAFSGCSSLNNISIPEGISSIENGVFSYCSSLSSITIPEAVTSIGIYAFLRCSSLTNIRFEGSVPVIDDSAFYNVIATAQYPENDTSWTTEKLVNYGGRLTWIPSTEHVHTYTPAVTAPTCTEQGYTTYTCDCGDSYIADYVDALGHDVIILPAEEAGCTNTGLTEGQKCSVCGEILVAQEVIPVTHQVETLPGTPATCTETGLTDGKKCSVCGVILEDQETIPLAAHTEEPIPGTLATCTETGLTDGKKCSVCGVILENQETIPLAAHTEEPIPGKDATCTEPGLTEGKKCSVCGEIIQAQQTIPAGHNIAPKELQKATVEDDGIKEHFECSDCGTFFKDEAGTEVASEADYRIPAVDIVRLSSTHYSYDGKTKTPKVGVYDSEGKKLEKDKDYTVTYAKGRKKVGEYNVTMKGIGDYDFRTTLTFQIVPPKSSIKSLTGKAKSFTASWSKKTSQVTGYQLQYSPDKAFETGVKTVTIKDHDVTSKTIKSLKSKKSYYVRIRTYKSVSGKNFYSSWSDAMRVKTK